jgi:1,4-dihydroxy-2-naphthoate octaprenyltransferase
MASLKAWVKAARPRTLPLAITCVLIGAAISLSPSNFSLDKLPDARFYIVLGLTLLTVIYLQVLANFANDYGDFIKGTDGPERSDRAMASGEISKKEMKRALVATSTKAFAVGSATVLFALDFDLTKSALTLFFIALGCSGIYAAIRYTMGSGAYGYKGLGDFVVLMFFGYIGVLGVAYLLSGELNLYWLLPATFSGLMSVVVLNLNNLRDHVNDAKSGKNTLVVKLGFKNAKLYHAALILVSWTTMLPFLFGIHDLPLWKGGVWYVLIALIQLKHLVLVMKTTEPERLDPELKKIALTAFVVALFMFLTVTA